jgi:hypothetical protein
MKPEGISAASIKTAYKRFGDSSFVEVCFYYNHHSQRHEFRVRWTEGRYVTPEIAIRFAGLLETALQHLKKLQDWRSRGNRFLHSDFDFVELI